MDGVRRFCAATFVLSTADAAAYNVMVGMGETYLPAYVLALGMSEAAAGLVATVPMLLGAVLQVVSPWAVGRLGSHRQWVVVCARVQATSLLALPVAAWLTDFFPWLVFSAATVYWAAGLATGPAWNTWIESIVPGRLRTRFLANRVRIGQICVLSGFLLGGGILQGSDESVNPAVAFGLLFCLAASARFFSAACLARQSEPSGRCWNREQAGLREVFAGWSRGGYGRLIAYFLLMHSSVFIAGPFFAPFMLSTLELSYFQYTLLIALGYAGKVLAVPMWSRFAHRRGARRLLWVGALGIVPLSALWIVSQSVAFLAFVQVLGGTMWGAHELAMFVLFLDAIPRRERTSALTLYNLGNAVAMCGGGLIGAILLRLCGENPSSFLLLFGLSSVARAFSLGFLARLPRLTFAATPPLTRTIAVRPSSGSIEQPILASFSDAEGV